MDESSYSPLSRGPRQGVLTGHHFSVYEQEVRFGGFTKHYRVVECGRRVGVLALKDQHVLLVRQYRFLLDGLSWELPGGAVAAGESREQAVIRECFEETGVMVSSPQLLIAYNLTLDILDNDTAVYVSQEIEEQEIRQPDPREIVEIAWIPFSQCLSMVFQGEIQDTMTIIGLLRLGAENKLQMSF